ncbi:MAG: hypothetical protein PSV13_14205, partial [Lacunisphaera sp.]|nr:hypothetical protein [Lacunisphaera sp.]
MKHQSTAAFALLLGTVVVVWGQETIRPLDSATVLEKFIVTESAAYRTGAVLPTSRPVGSVLEVDQSVLDLPRAVTVLTPELMNRFALENLGDLGRLG